MGPLWLDVESYELDAIDKEILAHPTVGGVILFARNYHDSEQLIALNKAIRVAAKKPILIGVDQEGGRVQRFREGFTLIPPANAYAEKEDVEAAQLGGWLMAAELIAHDVDLSFAPVLDKTFQCKAIGNRAFGEDTQTILTYSTAYMQGMKQAGMATTGKHFPGHGGVLVDSHYETPFDDRNNIFENDMAIFKAQIEAGILDAMMPAHVVYSQYDDKPASGSTYWLQQVLREQLGFKGIVFSDDLNMEGASIMGGAAERGLMSMQSGCDMILMCNNRQGAVEILDNLPIRNVMQEVPKVASLFKQQSLSLKELQATEQWQKAVRVMNEVLER